MLGPTENVSSGLKHDKARSILGPAFAALCVGILFVALSVPPAVALVIGSTKTVVRQVEGVLPTITRQLRGDDLVHKSEIIRTADNSATLLTFPDHTEFMVGPASEVILDTFIFDPREVNKMHLRIKAGLLKFRTGTMPSQAYQIRSRVATIGVRGTEFAVNVLGDGTTYIFVFSGIVYITDNFGRTIEVHANESAVVYPEGVEDGRFGPVRFTESDPVFYEQVRWLIALILLHSPGTFDHLQQPFDRSGQLRAGSGNFGWLGHDRPSRSSRSPFHAQRSVLSLPVGGLGGAGGPSSTVGNGGAVGPGSGVGPEVSPDSNPPANPVIPSNDGFLRNGDFEAGTLFWTAAGAGLFDVLTDIDGSGNKSALLTTGSPIAVSNTLLGTPDHAYRILFNADFLDGDGILDVLLDDRLLASFIAPSIQGRQRFEILVFDPSFGRLSNVDISFLFQAVTAGRRLLLDNVLFEDLQLPFTVTASVPTPVGAWLLVSPVTWWIGFLATRRYRRRHANHRSPVPKGM